MNSHAPRLDAFYVYRVQIGAAGAFKASDEVPMSTEQKRVNRRANRRPVAGTPDRAPQR